MCNLQYALDLLILTVEGKEDLRVIKLILYLFENMFGLTINYSKKCLYSSKPYQLPNAALAQTLNCAIGHLPLTYLGVPISCKSLTSGQGKFDFKGQVVPVHLENYLS